NYTLQYTFTTNNGGCTDSISQSIKILSIPVAKFTISDTTCEKNGIRFSDASTATEGKIVSWQWNFGDNTSEIRNNGNSFLKTYTAAITTPYTTSLIVVTDSGCNSAVTNLPVTVNFLPRPNFTMPEICLPDGKGQFVSTSTIPDGKEALFRYQWNFDDPNNTTPAIIQSPIHQYSQVPPPNGYQVKLIITSQQFCIDSITKPFLAVYPPPKASFTVSDKEICVGKSITFTDVSESANGSIVNRNWLINNSNFNNSPSFTQSFNDTGNFIIQLQVTDNKNCISSPVSNVITIHPYPILQLGGKNIYVLEGASIALKPANNNNYYSGNDLRFNWMANITPNYLNDATAAVPIATLPAVLDSVKYYLTLTGRGNCAVTDSLQVVILHTPNIPNAFSPNGDGFNQTWYIANIEAYPDAVVEVYNRYGQLVYFSKGYNNARGWDGTYQGKPLPMGTYYYIVDPKNGRNKMSGSVTIIR
ncbi:MAG: gliding motility-associated C-terminal domain-containing protein, partial [Chitinophagaceae bacterium]